MSEYIKKGLFKDKNFKNGFMVNRLLNGDDGYIPIGTWQFPESSGNPEWFLIQWYSKHCLIKNRKDVGSPYVITDKADSKKVIYNPQDGSLSMNLDATKVYNGEPHREGLWPHLLIEQRPVCVYNELNGEDKKFYRADCDEMHMEIDIRMPLFQDTLNPEGVNACQFMAYFYLTPINFDRFIWFGVSFLDSRQPADTYWNIDLVGTEMIYCLSTEDTFGGIENTFYGENGKVTPTSQWKHIDLNLTPHIDKVIELANRDNTFERTVKKSDFYIGGTNLGFETHGNINCTFDIKNFDLVSYISK